jgi:hypothetical protein
VIESSGKADKLKDRSHGISETQVTGQDAKTIYLRVDKFAFTLGEVALTVFAEGRQVTNKSVKGAVGLLLAYRLLQAMEGAKTHKLYIPWALCCVQLHLIELMR